MSSTSRLPLWRLAVCCLALLVACTLPAAADDAAVIEACLKSADADNGKPHDCIGRIADACLDKPENQSTHAMSACSNREAEIWDSLLNTEYQRLLGAVEGKAKDDIVKAQRQWIGLRDADCAISYELFDGGTMAQPIGANCLMANTAERMLQVRAWRMMVQPEDNN
ncbi:DUF1311 domain-containing protein [Hyphomicrobium sp. xq]|uniref:DUF1311 domain-containing protein n=1 Tax=Hyphomicrobium album TaxID=2665159 RepID=A0A6I3KGE9_9HYPH|nr:lysozyme inhibitor LprI family protein [Hyphomicrobium album]MTD93246.1 DUF1311 domain-containing protein [Hyphomicrobium album]